MGKDIRVVARLVYNNIPEILEQYEAGIKNVITKTLSDIAVISKESMWGTSKTGRIYARGDKYHQASAPGEAPAVDIGNLVNSIQIENQGLKGWVYTVVDYSVPLEYGSVRMAARPFFGPAAGKAFPAFETAIRLILEQGRA